MKAPQMYWHIHHDTLVEFAEESIEGRIAYIKDRKPANEIETRLRLMRPVQHELSGPVFGEFLEAAISLQDSWAAVEKAQAGYHTILERIRGLYWQGPLDKAVKLLDLACTRYQGNKLALRYGNPHDSPRREFEALHRLECPGCSWNGSTIFPDRGAA